MNMKIVNRAGMMAAVVLGLGFLAQPAWAYREWIHMSWEGLPTGLKPANGDVYFAHNSDSTERRTMDDSGTIETGSKWDVQRWGGSLHVPSIVTSTEGRRFHNPRFTSISPTSGNIFTGKSLYYASTWGDYTTGNVELGDDSNDSDYYLAVAYTEEFRIVQHYSGITLAEPADMGRTSRPASR